MELGPIIVNETNHQYCLVLSGVSRNMKWLILFLLTILITEGVKAQELTTGNLITNGNFETGNANGWTTSGDVQVLNDCKSK